MNIFILNAFPDKKIKSFGNKLMFNLKKNKYIVDLYIEKLKHIYPETKIHFVNGFDKKKLKKHILTNYPGITLIDHEIEEKNICTSIIHAISSSHDDKDSLFINAQYLINTNFKFDRKFSGVFLLADSSHNDIGCIVDNNNSITHCYYGLNYNSLLDILYLKKEDIQQLKKLIRLNKNEIEKYFLFELINLCILNGISFNSNILKNSYIDYLIPGSKFIKC